MSEASQYLRAELNLYDDGIEGGVSLKDRLGGMSKKKLRKLLKRANKQLAALDERLLESERDRETMKVTLARLNADKRPSKWMQEKAGLLASHESLRTELNIMREFNRTLNQQVRDLSLQLDKTKKVFHPVTAPYISGKQFWEDEAICGEGD